MKTIKFPYFLTVQQIRRFVENNNFSFSEDVVLEFPPRFTISPIGLAILAAWGDEMNFYNRKIFLKNKENCAHFQYMNRMHLFNFLRIEEFNTPNIKEKAAYGKFIAIKKIKTQKDLDGILLNIYPILHLKDYQKAETLKFCLSEILRNVLEHAQFKTREVAAFCCVQLYDTKKGRKISISVADCGRGIKKTFEEAKNKKFTNKVALKMALTPSVSAGTIENAGAGLFFTRAIAKASGGKFFIWSGEDVFVGSGKKDNRFEIYHDPFKDPHILIKTPKWFGTVVALEILVDEIQDKDRLFKWIGENFNTESSANFDESIVNFT